MRQFLSLFCLGLLLASPGFAEQSSQQKIVKASLVTDVASIVPGSPFHVGVILAPKEGWHTYWENPGDAGVPTTLAWTLPASFTNSEIQWPVPMRIIEGPLAVYGYPWPMLLPVTVTPPSSLHEGESYSFKVKANWLVCKDICIPESADLDMMLSVSAKTAPSEVAEIFAAHEAHLPLMLDAPASYSNDDKTLTLSLPLESVDTKNLKSVMFFPRQENLIRYAVDQTFSTDDHHFYIMSERAGGKPEGDISGLVLLQSNEGKYHILDITFSPSGHVAAAAPPTGNSGSLWFPVVLLLAVIGGLILNLMPCVLPVLSLKALSIAKKSDREHAHVMSQGVAYTLGILVTFALFSGVLLSLRQGGEAIGWGYQMQSPAFVGFLIYLLFLVGLSLSDIFHLPVLLGNVGNTIASESSTKGSFFTGVLAVAVATPCTAPFMASAVGAALTLPAWQAMLVFECLGLGLALPFLLISIFPATLRFLPKPGAWMETFKELLAFPMYASVIWLLWVLTLQTGAGGMVVMLSGMLVIVVALWMSSLFVNGSAIYRAMALCLFALTLITTLPMLSRMEITSIMAQDVDHLPFSKAKLDELRAAGKPVFVDATAAWCITCQVNASVAIHTKNTMEAFKENNVTFMEADWTRRNPEISDFLQSFGYQGVPLYVFYPADKGEPVVLPQLLTEDIVINTVRRH